MSESRVGLHGGVEEILEFALEDISLLVDSDSNNTGKSSREETKERSFTLDFVELALLNRGEDQPEKDDDSDDSTGHGAKQDGVDDGSSDDNGTDGNGSVDGIHHTERNVFIEDTDIVGESADDLANGVGIEEVNSAFDNSVQHLVVVFLSGTNKTPTQNLILGNVDEDIVTDETSKNGITDPVFESS